MECCGGCWVETAMWVSAAVAAAAAATVALLLLLLLFLGCGIEVV